MKKKEGIRIWWTINVWYLLKNIFETMFQVIVLLIDGIPKKMKPETIAMMICFSMVAVSVLTMVWMWCLGGQEIMFNLIGGL